MPTLSTLSLALVAFTAYPASAHWYLSCFGTGDSCAERSHQNPYNKGNGDNGFLQTAPIAPADTNPQMACGTMGVPTSSIEPLQVSPGGSLTAQWLHDTGVAWDVRMNANHHGFASAWLAPLASGGTGNVWTKIYGDGLQPTTQENQAQWSNPANTDSCTQGAVPAAQCTVVPFVGWWATDKLRLNGGKMPFTIPASVPEGKYIMRGELLTTWLPNTVSTAQGYIGCSVLQVGSGGTDNSAQLVQMAGQSAVAIPAAYQGAPWIHYQLYTEWTNGNQPANVPSAPGPAVWTGGSAGGSTTPTAQKGRKQKRKARRQAE